MEIKNGTGPKSLEFECNSMKPSESTAEQALCEICGQAQTRETYRIEIEILRWSFVGHTSSSSSSSSSEFSSPLITEIEMDSSSTDSD